MRPAAGLLAATLLLAGCGGGPDVNGDRPPERRPVFSNVAEDARLLVFVHAVGDLRP